MHDTSWLNRRVLTICLVEAAERFSYYGMNSQLVLFLTDGPASLPASLSASSVSLFTALAYTSPLLGANLASQKGMYPTILYLGAIYLIGALLLPLAAIPTPLSLALSVIALLLLALGTGGIKPNVAAFGAMQVAGELTDEDDPRLTSFFSAFYFVINIGAILGELIVPAIQKSAGYAFSFFSSFLVLLFSLLLFAIGYHYPGFLHESPKPNDLPVDTPVDLVRIALLTRLGTNWRGVSPQQAARLRVAVRSLRLLLPIALFWCAYSAMNSAWLLQVARMNLPLGLSASQWSALNPVIVLITLPLVSIVSSRFGISVEMRIAMGMSLGSFAVFLSLVIQGWIGSGEEVNGLWTLPQWVAMGLAEVLASVSSLELAHRGAPEELKSAMQAAWLLVSAGGNALAALVFVAVGGMVESMAVLAVLGSVGTLMFLVAWNMREEEEEGGALLEEESVDGEDGERGNGLGIDAG